ncbi:MAG TPA: serine/threonine-protein kinase [Ktedonobacteraceae bacterium]|nr:serine/threonine-protein kinase [Ktedonobacteraceae bacterium]
MMLSSQMFFCQECGAANTGDATTCFACHEPLNLSGASLASAATFDAQSVSSAPGIQGIQGIQAFHMPPVTILPAVPTGTGLTTVAGPLGQGAVLNGRYTILDEVGQGGYGTVFKARDMKQKNKVVAIKQIDLSTLSTRRIIEATDSYNREVRLLSKLRHKNLPRIYDHFTDPEHWYLVMDYIEGETLEDYLQKKPGERLPTKEAIRIGITLSEVLGYLHEQHPPIIFRDVKPANVMRTNKGRLYLIDFGIARHFNPHKTKDTGPLGSPGYAAPEQYGKAQSTKQTDIYGLGATLSTLLLGDPASEDSAAPVPTLPRRLRQLLDAMLQTDSSKRPASMRDVRERLKSLQFGIVGKLWRFIQSAFWGFIIGSVPFSLMLLFLLTAQIPFIGQMLGWFLFVLSLVLFTGWPVVLGIQLLVAGVFLFKPRHRNIGIGILLMLVLIFIAQLAGWIPWELNFLGPLFPFHFRFT